MTRAIPVTELSRHLSEYLNRVAYKGEQFVLLRGNKPVAELRPAPRGRRLGDLPVLLSSLPHLSWQEATAFSRDVVKANTALAKRTLRDPWGS